MRFSECIAGVPHATAAKTAAAPAPAASDHASATRSTAAVGSGTAVAPRAEARKEAQRPPKAVELSEDERLARAVAMRLHQMLDATIEVRVPLDSLKSALTIARWTSAVAGHDPTSLPRQAMHRPVYVSLAAARSSPLPMWIAPRPRRQAKSFAPSPRDQPRRSACDTRPSLSLCNAPLDRLPQRPGEPTATAAATAAAAMTTTPLSDSARRLRAQASWSTQRRLPGERRAPREASAVHRRLDKKPRVRTCPFLFRRG